MRLFLGVAGLLLLASGLWVVVDRSPRRPDRSGDVARLPEAALQPSTSGPAVPPTRPARPASSWQSAAPTLPAHPRVSEVRETSPQPFAQRSDHLHLPPSLEARRETLEQVMTWFREQRGTLLSARSEVPTEANASAAEEALASLESGRREALLQVLTPEELSTVESLNSDRAERLREDARDLALSDDEFTAALVLDEASTGGPPDAWRSLLGDERSARLELNQSPDYRFFAYLAERFGLPEAQRDAAYTAHRELLLAKLAGGWNEAGVNQLSASLGEAPFREYQQWIARQVLSAGADAPEASSPTRGVN